MLRLTLTVLSLVLLLSLPTSVLATSPTPINFRAFNCEADFASGTLDGGATISEDSGHLTLRPGTTEGSWTSPEIRPEFPLSQIITSWEADTPPGSWIETELSVHSGDHWSKWYAMGKWAFDASTIQRTSVNGQADADGDVSTDTYNTSTGHTADAYRLREILHSNQPSARPVVRQIAATASDPKPASSTTSATTMDTTIDLPVPTYSQEIHKGEYPQFDGGGEAWCSPTSTEMVVEYWSKGPSPADLRSLPSDPVFEQHKRQDASVDWAALHTYDQAYQGTGNWPFNVAYASYYGLDGSVRQFDSLQDIEKWIKQGVPVVISINWDNTSSDPTKHLDGAGVTKSAGHLMVVRGFTKDGAVITNDPAFANDQQVRHIYRRDQFEYRWQTGSAGSVYLIKPL